jgi:hypothetical protein
MKKFNVLFEHEGTLTCLATVFANDKDEINSYNIFDYAENIEDIGFDGDRIEIINIKEINEEV